MGSGPAHLRRRVIALGVGFILLIIATAAWEAWLSHRATVDRAAKSTALLAGALADRTAQMLREIDYALRDVDERVQADEQETRTTAEWHVLLAAHLLRLPAVDSVTVLDPGGALRYASDDRLARDAGITRSSVFLDSRRHITPVLDFGRFWADQPDRERAFVVGRSFRHADGSLAGVLIVGIAGDYLARIYGVVDVNRGTEVRVQRDDGTVLARHVDEAAQGARRIVVLQPVQGYPLVVAVSLDRWQALHDWRVQETTNVALTLALSGFAAILLAWLVQSLNQRAQAEQARRTAEMRLEDARRAEALSLFAASVAHDFNNVLSAVLGYAELIRNALGAESQIRLNVDRLLSAAERGRKLVRRVLTLDARRSLDHSDVALVPILMEVLDQVRPALSPATVLDVEILEGGATVRGDATEIYQAIANICGNAAQVMRACGGRIEVRLHAVRVEQARPLVIGLLEAGEWWCLSVRDHGPGVAPDAIDSIFTALYTTASRGQGTGLGLAIVRNAMLSMGGAIDVENPPGGGARFSLYWPAQKTASSRVVAAAGSPRGSGQTVMIVDDEPQLVALLEELLGSLGYEPVGFSDPQRALDAMRADPGRFDAVLTDERMPGLSGVAFVRAIRRIPLDLPVIMATAHRTADLDREAGLAGIQRVLNKPVQTAELATALADALSVPRRSPK